jgi:hypothetical protein
MCHRVIDDYEASKSEGVVPAPSALAKQGVQICILRVLFREQKTGFEHGE